MMMFSCSPWNSPQSPGDQKKNRDHQDYCIVEIGQNSQKSPEDLKRFDITSEKSRVKTGVKNPQGAKYEKVWELTVISIIEGALGTIPKKT